MRPVLRLELSKEFAEAAARDLRDPVLKEFNSILDSFGAEIELTRTVIEETLSGKRDAYLHWNDPEKLKRALERFKDDQSSYDVFMKGNSFQLHKELVARFPDDLKIS
jgi:hypothetical protein